MIIRRNENIDTIRMRHAKEIQIFQGNCSHEDISDWMRHSLDGIHSYSDVKICNICGKTAKERGLEILPKEI